MEPRIGIIGGSGLGQALFEETPGQSIRVDTPFGPPSADPLLFEYDGVPVVFLARHGVGHIFSPTQVPYRANIYVLKSLGCQWIIASGAVGSLREHIGPGELVLVDQALDKTTRRIGSFFDGSELREGAGAVHVELAEPFCPQLRQIIWRAAGGGDPERMATDVLNFGNIRVHGRGTYVCMEGPAFSTRAESLMHRTWGGDLIGMTAMPEAKLAREAEISYALIALATDYDCWRPHTPGQSKQALLTEIIGHLQQATANALALVKASVPALWQERQTKFAAHQALELAIWSDKTRISNAAKERLKLLWGKYF